MTGGEGTSNVVVMERGITQIAPGGSMLPPHPQEVTMGVAVPAAATTHGGFDDRKPEQPAIRAGEHAAAALPWPRMQSSR